MQKGTFLNFEDAYTEIFDYVELYYNRKRRHSSINYDIPDLFEEKFQRTQKIDITLSWTKKQNGFLTKRRIFEICPSFRRTYY
jgi:hypothetical protein